MTLRRDKQHIMLLFVNEDLSIRHVLAQRMVRTHAGSKTSKMDEGYSPLSYITKILDYKFV